jgi:hypothetical protein
MDKKCNKCDVEKSISCFHKDSSKIDGYIKLNHYTNMRPLCSYVNRCIKKNKIIHGS